MELRADKNRLNVEMYMQGHEVEKEIKVEDTVLANN